MTHLGRTVAIFAMALISALVLAGTEEPVTVSVTEFGAMPDSGRDATIPFQKAIAAIKKMGRPAILRVPQGRYDFFPEHAIRRACYYSNATESGADAVRTIALDLSDLNGFTLEGHNAKCVMRGKMTMIVAERSHDLSIEGLEFDFARPTVSEITAVEKGAGFWIGRVHPDSAYRLIGPRIEWYGENWTAYHNLTQHYDPATQTTWRGDDPTDGATAVRELEKGLLRFEVPSATLQNAVVGRVYQFRDVTRDEAGMWFSRCRNVKLERLKIRFMAGFGALFQFTENVSVNQIEVAPDPSGGRTCASAADILHFSGCKGAIRLTDSVLSAAHDDAINVHGTHLQVVKRESANRIGVRFMHPQTWGFAAFAPGDEIEFVRADTLLGYAKARVAALQMTGDPREQVLTLDRAAPSDLALNSDVVENVTWTPSVEISHCDFSRVPTRAILVTTRRKVRIVGNRFFRIPMPCIEVADDGRSWYESGPVHDLLIEGNVFTECSGPIVQVDPQIRTYAGSVHRVIRIKDNRFVRCGIPAVSVRAVDKLYVTGNRFEPAKGTDPLKADSVRTDQVSHVEIDHNVIRG